MLFVIASSGSMFTVAYTVYIFTVISTSNFPPVLSSGYTGNTRRASTPPMCPYLSCLAFLLTVTSTGFYVAVVDTDSILTDSPVGYSLPLLLPVIIRPLFRPVMFTYV